MSGYDDYAPWRYVPDFWARDGVPNDLAADGAEGMRERDAREDRTAADIVARAATGDAAAARVAELARGRVAEGTAGCFESACWSVTYSEGYCRGRSDARTGVQDCPSGAVDGYRAGYARGYRWAVDHPERIPVGFGA